MLCLEVISVIVFLKMNVKFELITGTSMFDGVPHPLDFIKN